ncbi:hypothetical protein [Legionella sp. WA2022007384]
MRINILAGFIIMTLGMQCAAAANLNNYDLERRIFDVSYQLNQIAEEHTTDLCSGDIAIAAAWNQRDMNCSIKTKTGHWFLWPMGTMN